MTTYPQQKWHKKESIRVWHFLLKSDFFSKYSAVFEKQEKA